ncbi:MAG: DEAD/DEAH box helicase [Alphaproteobacteria bacterium]
MNFFDLGLSKETVNAIEDLGINEPTTVQADVIPAVLRGDDVFAIAPRGCGKTASYILPLIDIITQKQENQNILIITPTNQQSIMISDRFSIFNKYHEILDKENEANVIIATPDLLMDMVESDGLDLTQINILVVDDINFIKINKKLSVLKKILEILPEEKQNIVYTNRKSKDTDSILAKILKAPVEVKVDKKKELEAVNIALQEVENKVKQSKKNNKTFYPDQKAYELAGKNNSFRGRTPSFIFNKGVLASEN